ncbi:MAG: enolase C-terminal domain-like protein, partial [Candidatus Rokuibacteriota bacterium]
CGGEQLQTVRQYRPYLERHALDTIMVDVCWQGFSASKKVADLAETHEINVAPHNFYGHLATMMNAHFCAVVPNLRIMEIDPDTVPWQDELVTVKPRIDAGHLQLPTRPGWGTEVDEAAVRAHPPRTGA